uniref:NadR/Ttd14 AAA domain-containing protein n=1 Tax=Mycena chlorophos TaxID=658473 RepID=A0ABQ0LWJ8_MYCCL|nr:predicted protein [Mycena chlorophos]
MDHHPQRVYVVGPSSSGKTTLCQALAVHLQLKPSQHISEVARTVIRELGLSREHIGRLEMQQAILLAHLQREKECDPIQDLLCDRSALDPIVYAIFTAPNEEEANKAPTI